MSSLILRAGWDGRPFYHCPSCRTNGSGDHVPDSAECEELRREREYQISQ